MKQHIIETKYMRKHKDTKRYTRAALIDWKHSVKNAQKQCYVTGSTDNLEIHHAGKNFSEIFKAAHNKLNIKYHSEVKDYNKADLEALVDEVVNMHDSVIPVVLNSKIHKQLHDIYGEHVNMDQINEFKKNYNKRKTAINK